MEKIQLICTFTTKKELEKTLDKIIKNFEIVYEKIFVFNTGNSNELICSYNILNKNSASFLENSILVHRKKDTNTLYSINALNCIIRNMNNGILDESLEVPWENYKNCVLLTLGSELRKININLFRMVYVKVKK